jgi:hypothetical protein
MLATASIVKRASVDHEPDQVTAHTQQQPGRDHKSLGPNRTYTHECRRRTTTQTWQGIMSAGDANPHRRGRAQEAGGQTGKASTTHTHDTHWQVCREAAVGTNAGDACTTTQTWKGIMSAWDANPHRRGRAQEAGGQTGKASTTHTHDTHWQVCREAAVGTNAGAGVSASMQLHAQVGMQSNQTPGSWNNQAQHATT